MNRLISLRRAPIIGRAVHEVLALYGVVIPNEVTIGKAFFLEHRGIGTVLHPDVTIGDRVAIYHQVTIGQGDGWVPWHESRMKQVNVCDDVIIFAGAKVLGGPGVTTIGRGTIVGANAVLTQSTGEWEIWAGVPARCIGHRDPNAPNRFSAPSYRG